MDFKKLKSIFFLLLFSLFLSICADADDYDEIIKKGEIRHLGIPYAKFITGAGDGLSIDFVKGFAREIGVEYRFVKTDFENIISDLTGKDNPSNGKKEIKGDIIETGFTILPWRKKLISFARPVFPTQVWLVARFDSEMDPIIPGKGLMEDIENVKKKISGKSVLGLKGTCLDPSLYGISEQGASVKIFKGGINDLAPAVLGEEAESTLLDVADTLIALKKWPGRIKVIGPIGEKQEMAAGFRKESLRLRYEYNRYLEKICQNGKYIEMVKKYYPDVFIYFPGFFSGCSNN